MKCLHIPSLSDSLDVYKVAGMESGNNIVIGWKCRECNILILQKEMPTRKEEEIYEEKNISET